jgi:signal transduction histidine kinase
MWPLCQRVRPRRHHRQHASDAKASIMTSWAGYHGFMSDGHVDPTKYRLAGGAAVLLFGIGHGVHDALDGEPLVSTLLPTLAMAIQVVVLTLGHDLAERRNWSFRVKAVSAILVSIACGMLIRPLHMNVLRGERAAWLLSLSLGLGVLVLWLLVSYFPLQLGRARARALAAESAQRQAELQHLRSHLHPHFLLNTLNAVAGLLAADPRQARQLLTALGDLLRDALEDQHAMRSLGDETDWLRRYAQIFEIRHGGAIRFAWDIAPDTLDTEIPRLLLQPLLENAIEHGALRTAAGNVCVRSRRRPDGIAIVISDDGPGMPAESPAKPTGLGLRLVRDRLQLAHPSASMTIDSSSAGTAVTLVLPTEEASR